MVPQAVSISIDIQFPEVLSSRPVSECDEKTRISVNHGIDFNSNWGYAHPLPHFPYLLIGETITPLAELSAKPKPDEQSGFRYIQQLSQGCKSQNQSQ
ncbi:hypothetical protein WA026_002843 [Henosepilachna vigintioctopunctata]|uniref:Uncharacterized protein n=1 Tax=Henosepilachna vigintioctopunctata TaxID=420089 RepID=A0AAW1U1J2_9CUCU